jgi:hypothetical protein
MPDPDCDIPVLCNADAHSNSYRHTGDNSDTYRYAYSDAMRQRHNPEW